MLLGTLEVQVPGPPKVPKTMAQYPKIESMDSIGSILLAILEVPVVAKSDEPPRQLRACASLVSGLAVLQT